MGEKFKKAFTVPQGQHTDGAPVLVQRGTLLCSSETDKVLAQVALKNICPKPIKAAKIRVTTFDESWKQTGKAIDFQLENLNAERDAEFGENQVITLSDKHTHAISCRCLAVTFADGTEWTAPAECYWKPLEVRQPTVSESIENAELAEQFISDMKEKGCTADHYPMEHEGLWYCACGAQNTQYDEKCHKCEIGKEELFAAKDLKLLEEHRAVVIAEQEEKERKEKEEKEKRKKKIKKGLILAASGIALTLLTIFLIIPLIRYSIANSNVTKSLYDEAIATYEDLGEFLNSETNLVSARALKQISEGEIEEGMKVLLGQGTTVNIIYGLDGGSFEEAGTSEEATFTGTDSFSNLEKAKKEFYDFHGWVSDAESFDPRHPETAALTLTADFTPTQYQIKYESDGKITNTNPTTYHYESDAITLKAPGRTGYTFVSWSDENGANVTNKVAIPAKSHGDKTFKAEWKPNTYKVTIVPGEEQPAKGESFDQTDFEFTFDAAYKLPKAAKTGYTFLGWTDGKETYLEGTWQAAADVTLKPSFELTTYTVSYDLGGGEVSTANPTSFNMTTADMPITNPTRFGYKFTGWTWENQTSATTKAVIVKGSVGDKHLVAHWQGNPHTVSLNPNGGSVSQTTYNVVFGSSYTLPNPAKTGYSFQGWYSGNTKYTSGTWNMDKDLSVTASWKAKTYSIRLDAAGGSGASSSITTTYNSSYSLPTPTRKGYTFQGWYNSGTKYSGGTWQTDAEITLTASWKGNPYTVTLNANGGEVSKTRVDVVFGDTYKFPTPTRKGYDFTKWSTSSYSSYYSSGTTYSATGTWNTDSNVTLYAQWEVAKYTLTVKPNGGSYSGNTKQTVTYGQSVYLGSLRRTGYTFDGWYKGGEELGYSSFSYDYEDDITVTAHWTPDTFNVRLNANGGYCSASSYTFTYDSSYSLPTPTRDGYVFDGWYDSSGSYGTRYSSSGTWTSTSSPYTLYAHWTLVTP